MPGLVRAVAIGALVALAPGLAACSGGSSGTSAPAAGAASGPPAARWWSNSAAKSGTVIDAADPTGVAAQLHPSPTDYCGMLRETLAAGKSILPGVTARDAARLTSTEAFVAEIQRVAPTSVAAAWHTLGDALVAVVASGGDIAKVHGVDPHAVQRAAATVSADARTGCHVDLAAAPKR
jgi:hypothetical protein